MKVPAKTAINELEKMAFTVDEFCYAYAIRRNLAYKEMGEGRLVFCKTGRRTLIRKSDADAWLASLHVGALPNSEAPAPSADSPTEARADQITRMYEAAARLAS